MTDRVQVAKRRALAALTGWDRARAAVNDPDTVPARLDEIVRVAREAIATVSQDVVIEVDALLVELGTIAFPDTDNEDLAGLERETYALLGVLGMVRGTAAQAGFADADEDLGLPPGLRVPVSQLAEQLQRFTEALEAVGPALEILAARNAADTEASPVQTALIRTEIAEITIKVDLALVKTGTVGLVDVSGLSSIGRMLQRSIDRFTATVQSAALALSGWVRTETPRLLGPLKDRIVGATGALARRAAAWIGARTRLPPSADVPPPAEERLPEGWTKERVIGRLIAGEPLPDPVMGSLREVSFQGYQFTRLERLSGAVGLTSLALDGTEVSDLSPLSGLTGLTSLSLDRTLVSDLSPLDGLRQVKRITGVVDAEAATLSAVLKRPFEYDGIVITFTDLD